MNGTRQDPVAVAMGGVVIGAATGGAIICLVLFGVHEGARNSPAYLNLLFAGGFGGLVAAAVVAWAIARTVANPFRRAMAAMVAMAGAALIGALTIVADAAAGRSGLLALAGVCLVLMGLTYRVLSK